MNQASIEQTKPSTDYPSMYCHACGEVCVIPEIGVIGACPHCKTRCRFVGPLWSETAPLITVASRVPRLQ